MKIKFKFLKKAISFMMILATMVGTLFASSAPVFASDLVLDGGTAYSYTGVSGITGKTLTHSPLYRMVMDGKRVFCIESGIMTNTGGGYVPEEYVDAKKDILSKIAYYGYTSTSRSDYDYVVTQVMIWEELGDQYISSTIPSYHERKAEIMAQVNKHDTLPSFTNQTINATAGQTTVLKDTNGVLADMSFTSNTTNASISVDGNSILITPKADSKDGKLSFQKVPNKEVGTSIVYRM